MIGILCITALERGSRQKSDPAGGIIEGKGLLAITLFAVLDGADGLEVVIERELGNA